MFFKQRTITFMDPRSALPRHKHSKDELDYDRSPKLLLLVSAEWKTHHKQMIGGGMIYTVGYYDHSTGEFIITDKVKDEEIISYSVEGWAYA
jgi:hypothetical protein